MPPLPDPPPAPILWLPRRLQAAQAGRWPRRLAFGLAGTLTFILAAAWAVPPLLDWGRFRAGFAAIAAAQLGRPVVLSGHLSLRLLPEAVLTAADVSLPDQGDGVSAQLGAMRLQVAVLPLLAGRIVPRDLVLGAPVLRLPWPLPQAMTHPARPKVPRAFAAHMEGGVLLIGQIQVTGINASIHGGPEPGGIGAVQTDLSSAAFGAEGFAAFGGRTWRFTGALGEPDADGVSALDINIMGQGAAGRTGGSVQGTLADGLVQGRFRAGGPDLSLLMPAARLPWRIEAPFTADDERVEASAISLSLGAAPAEASLELRLSAPTRLDGRIHAAALNLDGWAGMLGAARPRGRAVFPAPPFRLAFSADRAQLFGGTLAGLQGTVASDGGWLRLEQAQATLPGQALLHCEGNITEGSRGLQLSGPASLDAPDLHATLAWLRSVAPGLADGIPPAVLKHARVAGQAMLAQDYVAVSDLSGELDSTIVAGGFGVTLGTRPSVMASLKLAQISLDEWLGRPALDMTLQGAGQRFSRAVSNLHIEADRASWYGLNLTTFVLEARTGPAGLAIDRAQAVLSGATLSARGAVGPDGSVANGRLAVATPDLLPSLGLLPARWRWARGLWKGAGSLNAAASGPPQSLAVQLRADLSDLVLEADWRADTVQHSSAGTVTLRHPGAPRLLASLGLPKAESWLGTGSLALRAQVSVRPGQISVPDFDLTAADLRLGGRLGLDLSAAPFLRGTIAAETLALPEMAGLLDRLPQWAAQLDIAAQQVLIGSRPALANLNVRLGLGAGSGLLDVEQAVALGVQWSGQVAFATAGQTPPMLAAQMRRAGAHLAGPAGGLPIDLVAGSADGSLDLQASGVDPGAWRRSVSGQARVFLRDAQISGFDLGQVGRALGASTRAGRAALQTALTTGSSPGLSGEAKLEAASGRLTLSPATLTSSDGAVLVQGWADDGAIDLDFKLLPAGTPAAHLGVRLAGPFGAVRAMPNPGNAGAPPHAHRAKRG